MNGHSGVSASPCSDSESLVSPTTSEDRRIRSKSLFALLFVVLASGFLSFSNLDFPLGYHADEPLKVQFVAEGHQNFHHPILLLQLARLGCLLVGARESAEIALVGRSISAISALGLVFVVFVLGRRRLSPVAAVTSAAIVGLSPIVAVHAHYFKEDILLVLCVALALLAGLRAEERPLFGRLAILGVAIGLAASSKYVGWMLGILLLIRVALASVRAGRRPFATIGVAGGVAAAVFTWVNYPMFIAPTVFRTGLSFELRHMTTGHGPVVISPFDWGFLFHFLYSLMPGLTAPVALIGLSAVVGMLVAWRHISPDERLFVLTALLFYVSAELSPTKPFPDFMRYMLPVVPSLALLMTCGLSRIASTRRRIAWFGALALVAAIGWSMLVSIRLVSNLAHDTRAEALQWLEDRGVAWKGEWFTPATEPVFSVALLDPVVERASGTRFLVASSFTYEQVLILCGRGNCSEQLTPYYRGYLRLFDYPYLDIEPAYRSFAFSNPVIRIVDIHRAPVDGGQRHVADGAGPG